MKRTFYVLFFLFTISMAGYAQQPEDRIQQLGQRLNALAITNPGLSQKVQLTVTGASIQEFVRALAKTNNLNINIDPAIDQKIYNNFTNETPVNILMFLAREYNLEISNIGSIISINKMSGISRIVPREIKASYNENANTLSLELNNDTLGAVARKIIQISRKSLVVPSTLAGKVISYFSADAPFDSAIEKMAFANNLKVTRTADNAYVFQALGEDEELYINPDKNTAVRRNFKPVEGKTAGGGFQLYSSQLNGAKVLNVQAVNTPIADLLKSATQEMGANYFLYSELKGNLTSDVKNIGFDQFLQAMFQGTDYTFRKENDVYLIGDRKVEGLRSTKVIHLQNRSIDTVQAMIPKEWTKGVEIREFREQNTLLLSGSAPQIKEIESFITQLDKVVPMVLIEVTLVDIRKSKSVKTGIRAGISDSIKTGGTILPGIDYTLGSGAINNFLSRLGRNSSLNLGRVTPNFYVGLSALENNQNVNVRSVPKLSTLNGHSANLSIGSSRYYVTRTQNVIPSLNSQTVVTEQYNKVEANLAISIRPIVSADDQVTLNIGVDISDFIGNPPDNAPPPTSTSKFESIIRAKNEDMIVLGGLERTENSESGEGVPLLSRIPILKWLFSSRTKATAKVVTVVFLKPTIIY